jgi:hypothetical protein
MGRNRQLKEKRMGKIKYCAKEWRVGKFAKFWRKIREKSWSGKNLGIPLRVLIYKQILRFCIYYCVHFTVYLLQNIL